MKVLILGGTVFLGRHLVEAAQARGHEVTLFNRGRTNTDLYPDVQKIRGDRDGFLDRLQGRKWDVVIDPSGFVPRLVRDSAELLKDAVEHYTFISSISVYSDFSEPISEESPLGKLEDETVEEITGETYGPLKALCEQAVEDVLPGRTLSLRAGLIVGPYDSNNRFPYWVKRVAKGGQVLAPDAPQTPTQFIHGRDLADWAVRMAEERKSGVFNATGPENRLTMGAFLEAAKRVTHSDATFTWASEEFLLENEVVPFNEIPLWIPKATAGVLTVDVSKAVAAGLTFRAVGETIADTWTWLQKEGGDIKPAQRGGIQIEAGLKPERERELLAAWKAQVAG